MIALIYMCLTTTALVALISKPYLLELLAERRRQKKLARRRDRYRRYNNRLRRT